MLTNMLILAYGMGNHILREAVQEEIQTFPAGIQARYVHLTERMIIYGANLGMPHTKAMKEVKSNANT